MSAKPIVIIFEGIDKSGKTTLKDKFNKLTNFKYIVLDRFTISSKVYAKLFKRKETSYYDEIEKRFVSEYNVLVILTEASNDDVTVRLITARERLPKQISDLDDVKGCFRKELENSGYQNKLILNTSDLNIDECIKTVIDIVNEMEKVK